MIIDIVNAIKEQAEHIKNIKSFKYEGQDLINAQNNNATIQIWVEDDIYTEYIVTKDVMKVSVNIDILDKVYQDDDKLTVHDNANKVAIVLIKLIEENYKNIVSVYDYSIMNLSSYTDDDLYGARITLYMYVPSPIDACNIEEYIDLLNEYEKTEDKEITINTPQIDIDEININPIKLKRNGRKRC